MSKAVPQQQAKADTRTRILETARELYREPLESSPTMDEIAVAVGISRATLYRYFDNRDVLLLSVLEEEAAEIAARVEKRIASIADPAQYIVEGMVQSLAELRKSEVAQGIFRAGNVNTVNRLLFDTDRLTNIGIAVMASMVERAERGGELQTTLDPELLVEWILRILISLVTVPSKKLNSSAAVRKLLEATMLPVLRD